MSAIDVQPATCVRRSLPERVALGGTAVFLMTLPFAHSIAVRNIALAVAIFAALLGWRSLRGPRPPLLWFFPLLALLGGLSLIWSIDPAYSRGELKPELLYPLVVFVLLFAVCRDRVAFAWCGLGTAFAIVLSAGGPFAAWLDPYTSGPGRDMLYNGAGFYSTWLVIVYPFALAAALSRRLGRSRHQLALAIAALALCAGYATLNRTFPYVAAAETVLMLGWAYMRAREPNRVRCIGVAAATAAILLVGLLFVQAGRHAPLPKQDQGVVTNMQRDVRWLLWTEAVERIRVDPLRGAGFGRGILRHELPKRYGNTFLWHAHNTPLNWGLQMGLPGVALLLGLFAAALWQLGRIYPIAGEFQPYVFAAMVMLFGVFLKNQTDDFFVRQPALAFWAALGAVLGVTMRFNGDRATAA